MKLFQISHLVSLSNKINSILISKQSLIQMTQRMSFLFLVLHFLGSVIFMGIINKNFICIVNYVILLLYKETVFVC